MTPLAKTIPWKFVQSSKVISRPDATIVVKELTLTERGRKAITSGSRGITEGALEEHGPAVPLQNKNLETA